MITEKNIIISFIWEKYNLSKNIIEVSQIVLVLKKFKKSRLYLTKKRFSEKYSREILRNEGIKCALLNVKYLNVIQVPKGVYKMTQAVK